jgi:hypothetical protein
MGFLLAFGSIILVSNQIKAEELTGRGDVVINIMPTDKGFPIDLDGDLSVDFFLTRARGGGVFDSWWKLGLASATNVNFVYGTAQSGNAIRFPDGKSIPDPTAVNEQPYWVTDTVIWWQTTALFGPPPGTIVTSIPAGPLTETPECVFVVNFLSSGQRRVGWVRLQRVTTWTTPAVIAGSYNLASSDYIAAGIAARPMLRQTQENGKLVLWWEATVPPTKLEASSALGLPNWTATGDEQGTKAIDLGSPMQFFRLTR